MTENLDKIDDFKIETTQGDFNFSNLNTDYLVIYFYPKDNTPGCTNETKDFNALVELFKKESCSILGISRDSIKSHQKFSDKLTLQFPLGSDESESICQIFDVIHLKKFMGKEYMGLVRSTFLINKSGNIIKSWRNVRVKDHAQTVLTTLQEYKS